MKQRCRQIGCSSSAVARRKSCEKDEIFYIEVYVSIFQPPLLGSFNTLVDGRIEAPYRYESPSLYHIAFISQRFEKFPHGRDRSRAMSEVRSMLTGRYRIDLEVPNEKAR